MEKEDLDDIIHASKEDYCATVAKLHEHIMEAYAALKADGKKEELKVNVVLTIDPKASPPEFHVEASIGIRRKAFSEVRTAGDPPQTELDLN